jgi:hypothetical protein
MIRTKTPTGGAIMIAYLNKRRKIRSVKARPKDVVQPDKPENVKLKKKEYWCPYCATLVEFKFDTFVGVYYCPCCGISDRDFYVRNANKLWGQG